MIRRLRISFTATLVLMAASVLGACYPAASGPAASQTPFAPAGAPALPTGAMPGAEAPGTAGPAPTVTALGEGPLAVTPLAVTPLAATPAAQASSMPAQETTPMSGTPISAPGSSAAVAQAKADLSAQMGVPADQIKVVGVEPVTWPDASLGCPQPDMMYAQVLTEGLRIRLEANGQVYEYHSGGDGAPVLCKNPRS